MERATRPGERRRRGARGGKKAVYEIEIVEFWRWHSVSFGLSGTLFSQSDKENYPPLPSFPILSIHHSLCFSRLSSQILSRNLLILESSDLNIHLCRFHALPCSLAFIPSGHFISQLYDTLPSPLPSLYIPNSLLGPGVRKYGS